MADDPNRDILPVREGSCVDTCRSSIDPRERHIVCKLDRCELEDRYLRLLEEAYNLKKLTNRQEDKIKRLATKLMRVTASPRPCPAVLDVYEDKNKIISLEIENSKLKDRISVLRNQLLSHTISGRSSSRSRNLQARPSSGRITCRSESSRTKIPSCHCIVETGDDANARNNLDRIEEWGAQKKEMSNRIAELEEELSACTVNKQREKVAENVEYIRVWRQMKQLNDKLMVTERENESLNVQMNDLKRMLEEKTKNNEAITTELLTEKKRTAEIDEQMLKAKDSQLSLREKDEQIKDLVNEMKILQQHNSELIDLSSKYGEVELENKELKKKVTEQLHDQENLKTAFSTEQANIVALQASNEQLLGKLEELQKNIDILTVQLTSFQTQTEKQEVSQATQISTKQTDTKTPIGKHEPYKDSASQVEKCSKCCEAFEKIMQLDIASKVQKCKKCCEVTVPLEEAYGRRSIKLMDGSVQTENGSSIVTVERKDQGVSAMTPVKEIPKKEEPQVVTKTTEAKMVTDLTPEKMLKLLEQAQISTSVNAARFAAQKSVASGVDYSEILDQNQRHSGTETLVQAIQAGPAFHLLPQQQQTVKSTNTQHLDAHSSDPNQILSVLFNILHEYSLSHTISPEASTLYRPSPTKFQLPKDINNNIDTTLSNVQSVATRTGCSKRKYCSSPYNRLRQEKPKRKLFSNVKKSNRSVQIDDTNVCTCSSLMKCNKDSDCDGRCCNSVKSATSFSPPVTEIHSVTRSILSKNGAKNLTTESDTDMSSIEKHMPRSFGTIHIPCHLQESFKSMEKRSSVQNGNNVSNSNETFHECIQQLDKCKEIVKNVTGIPVNEIIDHTKIQDPIRYHNVQKESKSEKQKRESFCSFDCTNDCVDASSSASDSFPLVIAEGQGLVELHIVSLQLSTSAKQIFFREKGISNVSLFVSSDIWNQETAYTPPLKCPKLNFNSSFVYRIPDLFSFFNYVLLEFVIFQVNVFHDDNDSYAVARGKLSIKDILDYPQNKLHYIAPVNSVVPCSVGMNFGQLSLWVRLSCDVGKVDAFKKKRGIYSQSHDDVAREKLSDSFMKSSKNGLIGLKNGDSDDRDMYERTKDTFFKDMGTSKAVFEDETSDTSEEMKLVKSRPVLDHSSLTVVKESEEEAEHMLSDSKHIESYLTERQSVFRGTMKWEDIPDEAAENHLANNLKSNEAVEEVKEEKPTDEARSSVVEFTALLADEKRNGVTKTGSADSINEVTNVISEKNWEKYKQRSLLTFVESITETTEGAEVSAPPNELLEKDTIIIEIVNMILYPKCSVMQNDDYQLLYIEYCFLGYCGADMETISLKKPQLPHQKLIYNFKRKFRVDEENHALQNNILRAMLDDTTNPNVKFIIVCEPLPEETDLKECVEVGFADFNIRKYALGNSEKTVSLPVYRTNADEQIGLLKGLSGKVV